MNDSANKLVFDQGRKPNLAMMLKAPARANKNPRNLWLLMDTGVSMDGLRDEGNQVAYVTGVLAESKLPEQFNRLPTRPLINIGVGTYNDIRDQYADYLGLPRPSTERARRTPKRVMLERRATSGPDQPLPPPRRRPRPPLEAAAVQTPLPLPLPLPPNQLQPQTQQNQQSLIPERNGVEKAVTAGAGAGEAKVKRRARRARKT